VGCTSWGLWSSPAGDINLPQGFWGEVGEVYEPGGGAAGTLRKPDESPVNLPQLLAIPYSLFPIPYFPVPYSLQSGNPPARAGIRPCRTP
jgi:hypothetical protein